MEKNVDIATIGEDLPLLEGIRTARAIRRLLPDPVPPELIRKVCEAGTFAPSGGNRQPWQFIAVTETERRAWVAERYLATSPLIQQEPEALLDVTRGIISQGANGTAAGAFTARYRLQALKQG